MRFVDVQGFDRPGQAGRVPEMAHRERGADQELVPAGHRVRRLLYAAVFSSEKNAGELLMDILDSYAAIDRGAAAAKDPATD